MGEIHAGYRPIAAGKDRTLSCACLFFLRGLKGDIVEIASAPTTAPNTHRPSRNDDRLNFLID